jgi:CubicO group peptidase (beta-lactamase class C family)
VPTIRKGLTVVAATLIANLVASDAIAAAPKAADPAATGMVEEQELRKILVERVDGRKWGTAIVIGVSTPRGRRIVPYGTLSTTNRRAVDGETVFEIASLTKIFTALLLADMASKHEVKLDAPVASCLPATVKVPQHGGKQITFADLATHTSGLPLRPGNLASQMALDKYAGYTLEQLYQGLSAFTLTRDPGSEFEYSNWGFGVLGNALAYCAGKNFNTLLHERVLDPLDMRDTRFEISTGMRARLAAGYDTHRKPMPNEGNGALDPAGMLHSTVADLLKFMDVFLGRGPPTLVNAASTMLAKPRPTGDPQTQIALGWRIAAADGLQEVWSGGRADGYRSYMAFDPKRRIAVIGLTNAATNVGVDDISRHVLNPAVEVAKEHPRVAVAKELLGRYPGRYLFDDGNTLAVSLLGTQIIVEMTGQGPLPVFPSGEREFYPEDIEARFVFEESGKAPAGSLVLTQDGQSWKARRVDPAAATAGKQ